MKKENLFDQDVEKRIKDETRGMKKFCLLCALLTLIALTSSYIFFYDDRYREGFETGIKACGGRIVDENRPSHAP